MDRNVLDARDVNERKSGALDCTPAELVPSDQKHVSTRILDEESQYRKGRATLHQQWAALIGLTSRLAAYERQAVPQPETQTALGTPPNVQAGLSSWGVASDREGIAVPQSNTGVSRLALTEDVVPPVQNPLTSSQSFFLVDSSGKERYLGSSSSWAFSWQIRSFLRQTVGDEVVINLIPSSEEATYAMGSASVRNSLSLNANDIPTRDYAEFLTNTTLFHLGPTYHLFEKESFMHKLDTFYKNGSTAEALVDLWHVQFLVVIAFGKLFLRRGASSLGPPGASDVIRALQLLPGILDSWEDPVLYVEVLCLLSLYLLTADIRGSAYVMIGQALRIALSLGMNREAPPGTLTRTDYERRRRLWWTLYIIDRKLSINMGAPLSITEKDFDISLPGQEDLGFSNAALLLHVKLADLEGKVMSAAFGINSRLDRSFMTTIREVFHSMTKIAEDFTGDFGLDLNAGRVSRVAATLQIMYYQCTIMTTRPILFVLAKQRLAPILNGLPIVKTLSEAVLALLKTCVGAATTAIKILSVLHERDLIEPFFPLDLQSVFSAGFILTLTTIAYPSMAIDDRYIAQSEEILDWMCSKGNVPAGSRRDELRELREAARVINTKSNSSCFGASPPNSNQQLDQLWNTLDIQTSQDQSDVSLSLFDGMGSDFTRDWIPDDVMQQDWFWAAPGSQADAPAPSFSGIP
ncbi:hypothetical protein A1O1_07636 [Capronia coronata CBS 617.96]|uniref:Xylanolytic transcriptional activator regulatory domain-containing protein n=1 Tax=Capronia coronata CBS 617.96 TaxID=1182541 RepID=W9XM10_9EURO|nr:uncharacterized protein A1O1_07636 [Capronia coronata CBS 617.96]EXJ81572.1 hypothetical protein A1O1_07636 [Capronia coronata CBS 617.96]